jgi:hypothetical protein
VTLPDGKYGMRKLEELFDLAPSTTSNVDVVTIDETRTALAEIDDALDKIDAALPSVRDLNTSDSELDNIATMATESFQNLSDLGMNIDSRYAAEIFAVASTMLGHALTAKTAKLNKKLKMVDLQLKKLKMDQDQRRHAPEEAMETAHGQVLSRNDLLERLIASGAQNNNKA